jgi:hypothetical protein
MSEAHSEAGERIQMLERLISGMGFGSQGNADLQLETYVGGTGDIPLPWLREGLRQFASEPGRQFVPSLAEIRTACALAVRRHRDEARGEDPPSVRQVELSQWHVESAIKWAAQEAPLGVGQMHHIYAEHRAQKRLDRGIPEPTTLAAALSPGEVVGEGASLAKKAEQIARQGVYVPIWSDVATPDEYNGRLLALMLANRLSGNDALWPEYDLKTHRRLAAAMERHRARGGECLWWDQHADGWERRAS